MTYVYEDPRGGYIPIEDTRTRLGTLTLLMRWSGMRIRDAILLSGTASTGIVSCSTKRKQELPFMYLFALRDQDTRNSSFWYEAERALLFWSGNGKPKSAVADWKRAYRRLFKVVNIRRPDGQVKRCHPHMFRDTFAVEVLLAGVPIDEVSLLLGHASVTRQSQSQESVRNACSVPRPYWTILVPGLQAVRATATVAFTAISTAGKA